MPKRSRSRSNASIGAVLVLVAVIAYGAYYMMTGSDPLGLAKSVSQAATAVSGPMTNTAIAMLTPGPTTAPSGTTVSGAAGSLPEMATKPSPEEITFKGCPPEGDGGDTIQNRLKNRIDEGNYVPVSFEAIASLTWPKDTERRDRADWSADDTAAIAHYEGIPVSMEGYLTAATESGPESTNCHGTSNDMSDWHVSVVKNAGEDRTKAIVVETTPRVRPNHKWTLDMLRTIVDNKERVRISGWVFFDPEHPDHLGKYRITLWEIHPVMKIEVERNGQWVNLDS